MERWRGWSARWGLQAWAVASNSDRRRRPDWSCWRRRRRKPARGVATPRSAIDTIGVPACRRSRSWSRPSNVLAPFPPNVSVASPKWSPLKQIRHCNLLLKGFFNIVETPPTGLSIDWLQIDKISQSKTESPILIGKLFFRQSIPFFSSLVDGECGLLWVVAVHKQHFVYPPHCSAQVQVPIEENQVFGRSTARLVKTTDPGIGLRFYAIKYVSADGREGVCC